MKYGIIQMNFIRSLKMFKNKNLIIVLMTCLLAVNVFAADAPTPKAKTTPPVAAPTTDFSEYAPTKSLDIVANPKKYLNKKVKVTAIFDKFCTMGLDYKPAFRDSQKYISFLIRRDDVTDHTIPLSEMKIFIKRDMAEKFIDLESGDKIEFNGYVFSAALGDPWFEVEQLKVLTPKKPKTKK